MPATALVAQAEGRAKPGSDLLPEWVRTASQDPDAKPGVMTRVLPERLRRPATPPSRVANDPRTSGRSKGVDAPVPSAPLGAWSETGLDFSTDQDGGGLWVVGGSDRVQFKARFAGAEDGGAGLQFIPRLGYEAPKNYPLELSLRAVSTGGRQLGTTASSLSFDAKTGRVDLDHGSVVERFWVDAEGVEQTFVFRTLDGVEGDLVVEIDVVTELVLAESAGHDGGFEFRCEHGGVDYGQAFAVDAVGKRLSLSSSYSDGVLRHTIPSSFLRDAVLPLVLDPEIGPVAFGTLTTDKLFPDAGYEPSTDTYIVVHERDFSATDGDVYRTHLDADGNEIMTGWMDLTSQDYRRPSAAGKRVSERFLVAAQAKTDNDDLFEIRVRTLDAVAPFTMGSSWVTVNGSESGNKITPDVGGDYHPAGPTYWTVVWERVFSSTDSDVHMRQVFSDGQPRGTSITLVDNGFRNDQEARISEHCGDRSAGSQSHCIVWFSGGFSEIEAETYTWNGALDQSRFPISVRDELDFEPDVSGLSQIINGKRYFCVVYRYGDTGLTRSTACALLERDGTVYDEIYIANPFFNRSMLSPSVDCDGQRFYATCERQYLTTNAESDVLGWSMAIDADDFLLRELDSGLLESTTSQETFPDVASRYGDPMNGEAFESLVVSMDDGPSPRILNGSIVTALEDGILQTELFGCGSIDISVSGQFFTGGDISASLIGNVGPSGFVIGFPFATPIPCGPCTLGVDGFPIGAPLNFTLPQDGSLVGLVTAIQGYDLLGGPCLNTAQFTDMVSFTIR